MSSSSVYTATLHKAWDASKSSSPSDPRTKDLEYILVTSTHKTYKYLLVNGLLGKAAGNHNPLVLQAGSKLQGAWDARSVCHKHLVPFERDFMDGRLGASNEPFLNKPARFPELSASNAVRAGQDHAVLMRIIALSGTISGPDDAFNLLVISFRLLRSVAVAAISKPTFSDHTSVFVSLRRVLEKNIEGECLTYAVGLMLQPMFPKTGYKTSMHPTNQSGSSSNEVGDIDIIDLETKKIVLSLEVKDKPFTRHDFEHAQRKAHVGGSDFYFISRKSLISAFIAAEDPSSSLKARIISIETLLTTFKLSVHSVTNTVLSDFNTQFVRDVRPKPETLAHISASFAQRV